MRNKSFECLGGLRANYASLSEHFFIVQFPFVVRIKLGFQFLPL